MADFDNLPDATKYRGKTATDNFTGAQFFSDGQKWIPIPPVGGQPPKDMSAPIQPGFGTEDFPPSGPGAEIGAGIARHGVAPMIIPGALDIAATALTGPAAPAAVPIANLTGEAINQALGITEPSPVALGIAGGLPLVARGLTGAVRAGGEFVRPGQAAELLNAMGEQRARQVISKFRPAQAFKTLFGKLSNDAIIPVSKTASRIDNLIDDLQRIDPSAFAKELRTLKRLQTKIAEMGMLSPQDFQATLEVLGTRQTQIRGGKGLGAIKATEEALFDDLEHAAGGQVGVNASLTAEQAQTLQAARRVFLRTKSVERLENAIDAAFDVKRGTGDVQQFNPQQVLRAIKKDRFFTKAFDAAEQKEIITVLKQINRIPTLPPGAGVPFGSGRFIRGAFGGGIVGGVVGKVGQAAGLPISAEAGAAVGAMLPFTTRIARDTALALQFPEGRRLIFQLLKGTDGAYTPRVADLVGAFLAQKFGTTATNQPIQMPSLGP